MCSAPLTFEYIGYNPLGEQAAVVVRRAGQGRVIASGHIIQPAVDRTSLPIGARNAAAPMPHFRKTTFSLNAL
jgi:hypothetical protein